ncbi:MAG TPA: long-chain-fatty-acid--CoA ligase [Bryobacteraceae bacterium]|nr:long-chain-fatty-acid--CoA ligase [Bryobacteraceae bacterium]
MNVPLTPIRFLYRAMDLFARKVGIVCGTRTFTYGEFGQRALRLAGALRKNGIEPGDRVAFLSFNNHQLLEGYYGAPLMRAIVMPLNVRLSLPELIAILNHSGARFLLYENDFLPQVEQLKASCACIERFVALDENSAGADLTYENLLTQGTPDPIDFMDFDENEVAELFYTSGSTGTPKGVMLTHRTLYLHAMSVATLAGDPKDLVDLHTIPLFHANGWGRPQSSTMLGSKQVMVRRFEPSSVFRLIEEHRATEMSLVPTMANALLNAPDREQYDLSSMRRVMLGGAAASPALVARVEAAFHCEVISGYGMTETAPVLTTARNKGTVDESNAEERHRRHAMAGWAVPGMEIRVVDVNMHPVPRDAQTIGEVIARGDHLMAGYFKDPDATAMTIENGWIHTGDMGTWDEEGYIQIVDRKKEIIISGGENISSIEVEKAISSHPAVDECAVVPAPDERWGEVPAAIVVLKPGSVLSSEELMEFLTGLLGRFKLPRIIEFREDPLPKTGTGKIRKLILKEKFWTGKEKRVQG